MPRPGPVCSASQHCPWSPGLSTLVAGHPAQAMSELQPFTSPGSSHQSAQPTCLFTDAEGEAHQLKVPSLRQAPGFRHATSSFWLPPLDPISFCTVIRMGPLTHHALSRASRIGCRSPALIAGASQASPTVTASARAALPFFLQAHAGGIEGDNSYHLWPGLSGALKGSSIDHTRWTMSAALLKCLVLQCGRHSPYLGLPSSSKMSFS